jgi:selenoprotein W-related protein
LTSLLLTRFKQQIESFELQPSTGGCFELMVDGALVYSKLATGIFPDEEQLVADLATRRG